MWHSLLVSIWQNDKLLTGSQLISAMLPGNAAAVSVHCLQRNAEDMLHAVSVRWQHQLYTGHVAFNTPPTHCGLKYHNCINRLHRDTVAHFKGNFPEETRISRHKNEFYCGWGQWRCRWQLELYEVQSSSEIVTTFVLLHQHCQSTEGKNLHLINQLKTSSDNWVNDQM